MLFAIVRGGFIRPCYGDGGKRRVLGILGALGDSLCVGGRGASFSGS